jgi:hypothetical protein
METYTDYLMLIAPPKSVMYDIDRYKRASARMIGNFQGLTSPAHISINQQHRCKPFMARHAISQMGETLGLLTPQTLHISNFKYFNNADTSFTIYACIVVNDHTGRWFKGLQNSMRIIRKQSVPHIVVVKNIPADKFRLLWPKFEHARFQTSFIADKLTVLEKETYTEGSKWKIYKEFKFGERLMG